MAMNLNNLEIRQMIEQKRLRYYEVAHKVGVTPVTLSIWMQTELTDDRRERVLKAIESFEL